MKKKPLIIRTISKSQRILNITATKKSEYRNQIGNWLKVREGVCVFVEIEKMGSARGAHRLPRADDKDVYGQV